MYKNIANKQTAARALRLKEIKQDRCTCTAHRTARIRTQTHMKLYLRNFTAVLHRFNFA